MANTTGKKFGGRTQGTPNKKNQEIYDLAEELQCSPVRILMHFALGDYEALGLPEHIEKITTKGPIIEPSIMPDTMKSAAADLMPYMYGKRKPVDSEGNDSADPISELADAIRNR